MLDTSPLISTWKFCDQDLIGNFFGGGGSTNEKDWGEVTKEELGDVWMPIPYYYNALKPVRYGLLSLTLSKISNDADCLYF